MCWAKWNEKINRSPLFPLGLNFFGWPNVLQFVCIMWRDGMTWVVAYSCPRCGCDMIDNPHHIYSYYLYNLFIYYVLLFISLQYLLCITYIAIQTHMNVHRYIQWSGMQAGSPYIPCGQNGKVANHRGHNRTITTLRT